MTIKLNPVATAILVAAGLSISLAFADANNAINNTTSAAVQPAAVPVTNPPTPTTNTTTIYAPPSSVSPGAPVVTGTPATSVTTPAPIVNAPSTTTTTTVPTTAPIATPTTAPTTIPATTPNSSTTAQPSTVFSQEKIMLFSQNAAIAAFTYDYKNYQESLRTMQSYFTATGWNSFNKALTESNNLEVVQKEKLIVTAALNGQAQVMQNQQSATGQTWQADVPIIVTYKTEQNQIVQQDLTVKLSITTVSTNENANGIGITQFIATPNVAAAAAPAS